MANPAAVARALEKASSSATPTRPSKTQWSSGGTIFDQYSGWTMGRSLGGGLPREWEDFLSGAFGPLTPIQPIPIDTPPDGSDRPEPRRWQYPVGWNLPVGQPGSEGLKLATFAQLRGIADAFSVIRAAIQVRKEEVLGIEWDIVPTDDGEKAMKGNSKAMKDWLDRREQAIDFFRQPDPEYHGYQEWLGAFLEDLFVVDAGTLYLHPPLKKGKGPFGSDLASLDVIDGTTLRPLVDVRGGKPRPPNPAYQQYLWGIPRSDFMDIILDADIDGLDEPVTEYRADQVLYLPYTNRSWTPYGFPAVERALVPATIGYRRQEWQIEWFTEGTIPGMFVTPGPDVSTPQQIEQLQETLNAIANDTAWKHRIIVLPPGSHTAPQKNIPLADQFDEINMTQVLMALDVMPMELGISPKVSTTQSPGAANQMAKASQNINERKALRPLLQWLKNGVFDYVLHRMFKQTDMQWVWSGVEQTEDLVSKTGLLVQQVGNALRSIDEARNELGLAPWGLPETGVPIMITPSGVVPMNGAFTDPTNQAFTPGPAPGQGKTPGAELPALPGAPGSSAGNNPKPEVPTPQQLQQRGTTPLHQGNTQVTSTKPGPQANSTPGSTRQSRQSKTTKAQLDELKGLERYLSKDKPIEEWEPRSLPSPFLAKASRVPGARRARAQTGKGIPKDTKS